jgi:hypothetical protein
MTVGEGIPDIKKVNPLDIAICVSYAGAIFGGYRWQRHVGHDIWRYHRLSLN